LGIPRIVSMSDDWCFWWKKWRGQSSSFEQIQTLFFKNLKGFFANLKKWYYWKEKMIWS